MELRAKPFSFLLCFAENLKNNSWYFFFLDKTTISLNDMAP